MMHSNKKFKGVHLKKQVVFCRSKSSETFFQGICLEQKKTSYSFKKYFIFDHTGNTLVPPTTPRFGHRTTINLTVHSQYADGEIGFRDSEVTVTEPENSLSIHLVVLRDGTLHRANLLWSIVGVEISTDLLPTSGSLFFEKGTEQHSNALLK